jgi:creatinine amidohydrolase
MRVSELNWMQLAACLERDDRAVLPVGSTEQHAYLSLCTDNLLAERVALEAAEPLGLPVFPVLPYGITPSLSAYPGTVTLSVDAFTHVIRDILDSLHASGVRRLLIVNGHGGNAPLRHIAEEWVAKHPGARVKVHDWWKAPRTRAKVEQIDKVATHASWMENFPWTRLEGVTQPTARKAMVEHLRLLLLDPAGVREMLGDGNFGGLYQRADEEMQALWEVAVEETRGQLREGWY